MKRTLRCPDGYNDDDDIDGDNDDDSMFRCVTTCYGMQQAL